MCVYIRCITTCVTKLRLIFDELCIYIGKRSVGRRGVFEKFVYRVQGAGKKNCARPRWKVV